MSTDRSSSPPPLQPHVDPQPLAAPTPAPEQQPPPTAPHPAAPSQRRPAMRTLGKIAGAIIALGVLAIGIVLASAIITLCGGGDCPGSLVVRLTGAVADPALDAARGDPKALIVLASGAPGSALALRAQIALAMLQPYYDVSLDDVRGVYCAFEDAQRTYVGFLDAREALSGDDSYADLAALATDLAHYVDATLKPREDAYHAAIATGRDKHAAAAPSGGAALKRLRALTAATDCTDDALYWARAVARHGETPGAARALAAAFAQMHTCAKQVGAALAISSRPADSFHGSGALDAVEHLRATLAEQRIDAEARVQAAADVWVATHVERACVMS